MSKFIVVEGVDGAGKSTLVKGLQDNLAANQIDVVVTREPGGSTRAEEIRKYVLSDAGATLSYREQLELIHEARLDHIETVIKPALSQGTVVISDRFELSSWVYQVWPDQEAVENLYKRCELEVAEALEDFHPVYLVLRLDSKSALERLRMSREINHLDAVHIEAINDRLSAYESAVEKVRGKFHEIDASRSIEDVLSKAIEKIG